MYLNQRICLYRDAGVRIDRFFQKFELSYLLNIPDINNNPTSTLESEESLHFLTGMIPPKLLYPTKLFYRVI